MGHYINPLSRVVEISDLFIKKERHLYGEIGEIQETRRHCQYQTAFSGDIDIWNISKRVKNHEKRCFIIKLNVD